ncbi:MAG TPA: DedA family protein [Solirubrobacteraceae bacterium]|nr:DedA family protein [Solirubrobacteraceae bacterium]
MLAAIIDLPANVGYAAVFALIAVETMGIPVPGETALIGAALLAHDGQMSIVVLVALAAAAAIIGDNAGFAIGRKGGRRLFARPGPFHHHRLKVLEHGEPFFARHGPKAVFLGRWVSGLRIASAWLAGMNRMEWPTFLFWNALGGIAWAASIGLGVYFLGHVAEEVISTAGPAAAVAGVVALVCFLVWRHRRAAA